MIHIDIQWFLANCDDADKVVAFITKSVLDELRDSYPEVLPQEVVTIPDALSRVKDRTGQKFVVIIDEWDVQMLHDYRLVMCSWKSVNRVWCQRTRKTDSTR